MIKGYFYIICLIYFYLVSCSEVNTKRNKVDTISTVSSVLVKKNTVNLNNTENLDTSSDSELIDILNQYKAEYNRNYNVDTSFKVGSDLFHVIFKYKCTFDSGLNIPQKVISIYGLKKFITHNFISSVLVFKNEEPFIKQEINKNTFSELCLPTIYFALSVFLNGKFLTEFDRNVNKSRYFLAPKDSNYFGPTTNTICSYL